MSTERLLITKNGVAYSATIAAGTASSLTTRGQLNLLKPGSITYFEKNGTLGSIGGSFTKTDTKGLFALGMPTGFTTKLSPFINCDTLQYSKLVYVPATTQVTVLGDDGVTVRSSGAMAAGDVGTEFLCTTGSSGGDFNATSTPIFKVKSTGAALAGTDILLNEKYIVTAAGTPDTWGGGVLTSSLVGTLAIGTKAIGASYGVQVVDLSKETWERRIYDISLTLESASKSDAAMLAAVVAAFNADPNASLIAVAAVATANAGITFTGVTAGERFTILPTGLLYGSTVTSDGSGFSQVATDGQGTNAQILALEVACSGIEGKTSTTQNNQLGEVWKVPSLVESGLNYTTYVLTWTDQREVAYPVNMSNPMHKMLNIAVPSADSTCITALDNLLADLVS